MRTRRESAMVQEYVWPHYSKEELVKFGVWLEGFREEHVGKDWKTRQPRTYHAINFNEARVAYGAMVRRMHQGQVVYAVAVKRQGFKDGHAVYDGPTKYQFFEHKMREYEKMKYGEFVKLQGLEELAPPVRVQDSIDFDIPF